MSNLDSASQWSEEFQIGLVFDQICHSHHRRLLDSCEIGETRLAKERSSDGRPVLATAGQLERLGVATEIERRELGAIAGCPMFTVVTFTAEGKGK
jgi:hypothetical protein